jgi:hypothetical protein
MCLITNNSPPPSEDQKRSPGGGRAPQFRNLWYIGIDNGSYCLDLLKTTIEFNYELGGCSYVKILFKERTLCFKS